MSLISFSRKYDLPYVVCMFLDMLAKLGIDTAGILEASDDVITISDAAEFVERMDARDHRPR